LAGSREPKIWEKQRSLVDYGTKVIQESNLTANLIAGPGENVLCGVSNLGNDL
jgi:hypothetical protein